MSAWHARLGARTVMLALFWTALAASGVLPPPWSWAAVAAAFWLWCHAAMRAAVSWLGDEHARHGVTAIIVAVAAGSVWYRVTQTTGLGQTAALFVGVPAVLAIVVTHLVSPRSARGVAVKAVTIGLLVSLMLLDEGILCVLMSAPLFYFVAISLAGEWSPRHDDAGSSSRRRLVSGVVSLSIIPMSLEGVTSLTTFDRDEVASVTRTVDAPVAAVEQALLATPRFERERPTLLRMGFPWPEASHVEATASGLVWDIAMRGGETKLTGMEPKTGTLRLALEHARPGEARWRVLSDDSHMRHFLTWVGSDVRYAALDATHTSVTWTIRYRRDLDPAWYFGPLERAAVHLAAGYLIDTVATP